MSDQRGKGRRGSGGRGSNPRGRGQAKGQAGKNQGAKGQGAKGQGKGGQAGRRGGKPAPDRDDKVSQLAGPLRKVLARLPETQRRVLELRMGLVDGHPKNLTDTAEALGMTMHEAKQVEQRAFEHIREAVPLDQLQKLLRH